MFFFGSCRTCFLLRPHNNLHRLHEPVDLMLPFEGNTIPLVPHIVRFVDVYQPITSLPFGFNVGMSKQSEL